MTSRVSGVPGAYGSVTVNPAVLLDPWSMTAFVRYVEEIVAGLGADPKRCSWSALQPMPGGLVDVFVRWDPPEKNLTERVDLS